MRKIYLFTSVVALGAASTHCSSDPEAAPAGTGGSAPSTGGASKGGSVATNGGTPAAGGASTGGKSSGGAAMGGSSSGGASGGSGPSGGAGTPGGGTAGTASGAGGAAAGAGAAGKGGGGAGGMSGAAGASGGGGKAGGGAAGNAGAGGAAGSGGGPSATFAAVTTILENNCGNACHKAGNGTHIVLSDGDKGLYARLTTPIPNTIPDCKGGLLVNLSTPAESILPVIVEKGIMNQFGCVDVPHMPNLCSSTGGTPACLSKGDIATIQSWVNAGAPKG